MEFTQLQSLKAGIQPSFKQPSQLVSIGHCRATDEYQADFQEVVGNLEEINIARSLPVYTEQDIPEITEVAMVKSSSYVDYTQQDQSMNPFRKIPRSLKKSNIFSSKASSCTSVDSSVRIFYFSFPLSKVVHYDKKTTIKEVIAAALLVYATETHFDQSKISSNSTEIYQLRFPKQQGLWIPDMNVDPIDPSRYVSENLFEQLVLIKKENSVPSSTFARRDSKRRMSQNQTRIQLVLFNELHEQVAKVFVDRSDTLENVFKLVELNGFFSTQYYLSQELDDQFQLPRHFEVKQLSFPKIYIKSIKYADQEENEKSKPFKVIENIMKSSRIEVIPPIGIQEASMYEEFDVLKINPFGIEQERILGVDQQKIYNYEKAVRKEHREVSFLEIIRGVDEQTGTKKPYRLVSDLKSVREKDNHLKLQFQQKTITFVQVDPIIRGRILRKLNFLLSYHQQKQQS